MAASHVPDEAQNPFMAVRNGTRLAGRLLCLTAVALVVVALRLGVYEYFHGEGRVLTWLFRALP